MGARAWSPALRACAGAVLASPRALHRALHARRLCFASSAARGKSSGLMIARASSVDADLSEALRACFSDVEEQLRTGRDFDAVLDARLAGKDPSACEATANAFPILCAVAVCGTSGDEMRALRSNVAPHWACGRTAGVSATPWLAADFAEQNGDGSCSAPAKLVHVVCAATARPANAEESASSARAFVLDTPALPDLGSPAEVRRLVLEERPDALLFPCPGSPVGQLVDILGNAFPGSVAYGAFAAEPARVPSTTGFRRIVLTRGGEREVSDAQVGSAGRGASAPAPRETPFAFSFGENGEVEVTTGGVAGAIVPRSLSAERVLRRVLGNFPRTGQLFASPALLSAVFAAPTRDTARADELSSPGSASRMPVFAMELPDPLVPHMEMPVRVFEPRYRLLAKQCIERGTPFVVAPSFDNGTVGTVAAIRDIVGVEEDGRAILNIVGVDRVRLADACMVRDGFGLLDAATERLSDEPVDEDYLRELSETAHELALELAVPDAAEKGAVPVSAAEARRFSWELARMLPVGKTAKQRWLGLESTEERLREQIAALRDIIASRQRANAASSKASSEHANLPGE